MRHKPAPDMWGKLSLKGHGVRSIQRCEEHPFPESQPMKPKAGRLAITNIPNAKKLRLTKPVRNRVVIRVENDAIKIISAKPMEEIFGINGETFFNSFSVATYYKTGEILGEEAAAFNSFNVITFLSSSKSSARFSSGRLGLSDPAN